MRGSRPFLDVVFEDQSQGLAISSEEEFVVDLKRVRVLDVVNPALEISGDELVVDVRNIVFAGGKPAGAGGTGAFVVDTTGAYSLGHLTFVGNSDVALMLLPTFGGSVYNSLFHDNAMDLSLYTPVYASSVFPTDTWMLLNAAGSAEDNLFGPSRPVTYLPTQSATLWDLHHSRVDYSAFREMDANEVAIDPSTSNPDGSDADAGAYGGPDAGAWFSEYYPDDDGDGMYDGWEVRYLGGDGEAYGDLDGDGSGNRNEFVVGTIPTLSDSDGDGQNDGVDPSPTGE